MLLIAGWINRLQEAQIEYLKEEVRVLREHTPDKRIKFTDAQRRRLGRKAKAVGRKGLKNLSGVATPDTLLRWFQRLVARKYDGSAKRGSGRPRLRDRIAHLVLKMAEENLSWGYTRIRDALHNLGITTDRNTVKRILNDNGIEPAPERKRKMSWSTFIAAHLDVLAAMDFLK